MDEGSHQPDGDYKRYYDLERYLFEEVGNRFQANGYLNAFDFFCIIIWKANRAKSRIAERLRKKGGNGLEAAVAQLTREIAAAADYQSKMKVLIDDWKFRLPMASAILTVLYPEEFTVYDIRVCEQLGEFRGVGSKTKVVAIWPEYIDYREAVKRYVRLPYSLRDKDRYLWGKSFHQGLVSDIANGMPRRSNPPNYHPSSGPR